MRDNRFLSVQEVDNKAIIGALHVIFWLCVFAALIFWYVGTA